MADKNKQHSNSNPSDVQELLAMLDRMQNRPRVQEVEDVLVQQGRSDLVRMDVYTAPKAQDGFVPNVQSENLSDLLIDPQEEMMLQMVQNQQQKGNGEKSEEHLFYGDMMEDEDWEQLPPPPEKKLNPVKTLLRGVGMMLPRKGDKLFRLLGKGGFWMGLIATVLVAIILVLDMKVAPTRHAQLCEELRAAYNETTDTTVSDTAKYPAGMLASFKQLYERNSDVKGWISFHAEGKDFLNIEYPFVQGETNQYYQTHDYDKQESDYGTLYLDAQLEINGYNDADRVLVIHSNGTPDQTMLSSMNRLVGPVDYARAVPELTLSTLYRRDIYYVFAMALADESGMDSFNPLQTKFADEDAFLKYVQSLCARSLFDYPVDVTYDDSIVLLTVPTGDVSTGVTDGHIVVAARRRRPGEISVQANQIMKNKNAIMPYSWYINHGKTPHTYFFTGNEPDETPTTTGSVPTTSMENPHGTTTTESTSGNYGGSLVNKNTTATGDTGTTDTGTTDSGTTDTTGTGETSGDATTESGTSADQQTGITDEVLLS